MRMTRLCKRNITKFMSIILLSSVITMLHTRHGGGVKSFPLLMTIILLSCGITMIHASDLGDQTRCQKGESNYW